MAVLQRLFLYILCGKTGFRTYDIPTIKKEFYCMAKCKCGRNGGCARIVSNGVKNMGNSCVDVCANPICGEPDLLSIMAPLIYDEIGVNLCTTFSLGTKIPCAYSTAVTAAVQVLGIEFTYGDNGVQIDAIAGRPNCYVVTLSNLKVSFAVRLYDSACRLVGTVYPTAIYLPPCTTDETYDADTNPTSVELEIFAPYGLSYETLGACEDATPVLNYTGFYTTNNTVRQGLNVYAIPKILGFSIGDSTITVGLTLVLQSLYFAGYHVANAGKIQTPRGSILTPDNSDCMRFVAGELLDLKIKPLELNPPVCEDNIQEPCGCNPGFENGFQNICGNICNGGMGGNCCTNGMVQQGTGGCAGNCCTYFATDNTTAMEGTTADTDTAANFTT